MSPSVVALVVMLSLSLVSMAVFALVRRGYRDPDAAQKGSRFMLGLGDFLLHWFLWVLNPAERALLAVGATPDHLNAGGLLLGAASGVLIGSGQIELGGWAILLTGVCDVLDGRLARTRGVASAYGKFIDSTLDRFVETFVFLGFAVYFSDWSLGPLVVTSGLGGSLLVSYAQARGETVKVVGSGGLMQRAERLVLMLLGCLFDPLLCRWLDKPEGTVLLAVLGLIGGGAFATAVYRTVWIARRLRT